MYILWMCFQQEVTNLRATLENYGATAKFLDEEKDKLEKEQMERERKEREFQEEMEKVSDNAFNLNTYTVTFIVLLLALKYV